MNGLIVRDMEFEDEYFVASCTHVDESDEIDASSRRRLAWFEETRERGLRIKVATLNGERVGFIYVMPIEVCPWGPEGRDLAVFPCLVAHSKVKGQGVGRALVAAAEKETLSQGKKGLVTYGYYHDFWFMPAAYFEKLGYDAAARRGERAILWKVFDTSAEPPAFPEERPRLEPVPGKVALDLFYNTFCLTSDIEAQRVRDVAGEFGEAVVLREYDAGDPEMLRRYGRARGIFVDGEEIFWGHEAPREGIREAISRALSRKKK
jgi:predicted N-acetyltransferase YhbS